MSRGLRHTCLPPLDEGYFHFRISECEQVSALSQEWNPTRYRANLRSDISISHYLVKIGAQLAASMSGFFNSGKSRRQPKRMQYKLGTDYSNGTCFGLWLCKICLLLESEMVSRSFIPWNLLVVTPLSWVKLVQSPQAQCWVSRRDTRNDFSLWVKGYKQLNYIRCPNSSAEGRIRNSVQLTDEGSLLLEQDQTLSLYLSFLCVVLED